jgi:hypothetical protein
MFSGAVKAVDPLGSAYKFNDYFQAFDLQFLQPFSLLLAIILFTAEFIAGFSVLSGYRQKTGISGVMLLMMIFTPLTLVLAITNPVSDCGCFGDAIHLTNWQTFWKNIVLLVPAIIIFSGRNKIIEIFAPAKEWLIILTIIILFVIFSILNLRYLQLFDFLPYRINANIPEKMKIPEDKPADEYSTTFIYEKDGVMQEFSLENYPADDSSWVFVDQKSVLVKKGYQPPIHDFIISTPDGSDLTEEILSDPGYSILMISQKLKDADPEDLKRGFELGVQCMMAGIGFYIVTASSSDEMLQYAGNGFTFHTGDETTLKTIIRSNPGYVLLKEGNILGKWSSATLPPKDQFYNNMSDEHIERINNKSPVLIIYSLFLSAVLLLTVMYGFSAGLKDRIS